MKLSILIVNYNGLRFLDECFASIREHVECAYEIIMVDNASIDGSAEYVKKNHPNVKLIESEENIGFSGGNNLAAKSAQGEILLLLNNDTCLLSNLNLAFSAFDHNNKLGALGCRLLYGDGRLQTSFGYEHTPIRIVLSWLSTKNSNIFPNIFHREVLAGPEYDVSQNNVAWVSGAFLMTRRKIWEELEGLDENYFMYVEDVDYCKRVRNIGHFIGYIADIEVRHYEGAGKTWIGPLALQRTMNSYQLFTHKFYGKLPAGFVRVGMSAVMLIRAFIFWIQSISDNSDILKEKRIGYFNVGIETLRRGISKV